MSVSCPLVCFEMLFCAAVLCFLLAQPALQTTASNSTTQRGLAQPSPVVKPIPSKLQTSSRNAKLSSQTTQSLSKLNQDPTSTNRSLSNPPKPSVPISHRASGDARPSPSQPTVKVLISGTCVQRDVQEDKADQIKGQGQEVTLQEGSPLILTQKISLIPASCSEVCGEQLVTLQARLEKLEKEVSVLRKKHDDGDGMCSPSELHEGECLNECSDQGRCEGGQCVCFPGFSGPDCSSATCPSHCHGRGACVDGRCVCESGYAGPDCSVKPCPDNCSHRGRCVQGVCQCDAGFSGIDCAHRSCPGNCNQRGRCLRGTCLCDPGFTGLDCSKCEAGFTGADCVNVVPGSSRRRIIQVNVETVTLKAAPGADKTNRKTAGKTSLDKAILSKPDVENRETKMKTWKEKASVEKDGSSRTKAGSSLKLSAEKTATKKETDFKPSSTKLQTNTELDVKSDSVKAVKNWDSDARANAGTEKSATKLGSVRRSESHAIENEGTGGKIMATKSPVKANGTIVVRGHKKVVEVLLKQPETRGEEDATKHDSKVDVNRDPKAHVKPGGTVNVEGEQDSGSRTLPKLNEPFYQNESKTSDSAKQMLATSEGKTAPEQTFSKAEPGKETAEQSSYSKNKTTSSGEKPTEKDQISHGSITRTDSKASKSLKNVTAVKYKPGSGVRRSDVIESNRTAGQATEPQRNVTATKDGQESGLSKTGLTHVNGTIDKPIKPQRNITVKDGGRSGFSRTGIIHTNGTTKKPAAPQRNITDIKDARGSGLRRSGVTDTNGTVEKPTEPHRNVTVSKLSLKSGFSGKDLIHKNGTAEKHTKPQRNTTIHKEVRGSGFKKATVVQVNETTDRASEVQRNITIFKDSQGPGYRRPGVVHTNGTVDRPKEPQKNITVHRHSTGSIIQRTGVHTDGTSEKAKETRRNITVLAEGQGFSLKQTGVIHSNGTADKPKGKKITVFTEMQGSTLSRIGVISTNKSDSNTLVQKNKTTKSTIKTGSENVILADTDRSRSQGSNATISKGTAAVKLNKTGSLKTTSVKTATTANQASEVSTDHHSITGQRHNGPQHDLLQSKSQPAQSFAEVAEKQTGGNHVVLGRNMTRLQESQDVQGNITPAPLDLATKMSLHSQERGKTSSSIQISHNVTSTHSVGSANVNIHSTIKTGPSVQTNSSSTGTTRTPQTLGAVRVQNITSRGFIVTWEAPQGMFKNFTVIMREYRTESSQETEENEKDDKFKEGDDEEESKSETAPHQKNTDEGNNDRNAVSGSEDNLNRGSNSSTAVDSSAKPHSRAAVRDTGSTVRKLSVVPGSTRSLALRNLRPQTRYSLSLYGTSPGVRSKIHHLAVTTAPEPPTELLFSNVTQSSLSVSWTKPRSPVTGFTVTYTNTESGETVYSTCRRTPVVRFTAASFQGSPVSLKVDPRISSVVLAQLQPGSSYEVSVTAKQGLDQSDPVAGLVVTVPDPPAAVKAVNVSDTRAVLQWVPAIAAVDRYIFVYGSGGGTRLTTVVSGNVAELQLKGLQRATKYTVTVSSQKDSLRSSTVALTFTTTGGPGVKAGKRFLLPRDCSQLLLSGVMRSGEALIYPDSKQDGAVRVFCDMETDGGGWTVFQRRMNGKTNFFRTWEQYSRGFGNLSGEFWLGNELIHSLTSSRPMVLRVDLRARADSAYATYSSFHVAPQRKHYAVRLSGYSGTAGDSMKYHNGRPFSTRDRDPNPVLSGCARSYRGGWWYKDCHEANLNGLYDINTNHQGVIWTAWKGKNFSIPFTEMKLRPAAFNPQTQG